jgi:hypothetical protein
MVSSLNDLIIMVLSRLPPTFALCSHRDAAAAAAALSLFTEYSHSDFY